MGAGSVTSQLDTTSSRRRMECRASQCRGSGCRRPTAQQTSSTPRPCARPGQQECHQPLLPLTPDTPVTFLIHNQGKSFGSKYTKSGSHVMPSHIDLYLVMSEPVWEFTRTCQERLDKLLLHRLSRVLYSEVRRYASGQTPDCPGPALPLRLSVSHIRLVWNFVCLECWRYLGLCLSEILALSRKLTVCKNVTV